MDRQIHKILIIVYYWPPSGGAGVQRWVKLAKYMAEDGIDVRVLTVDEKYASYLQLDPSLEKEVHPALKVYKTRSFEAINIFARIFGKKKVPTAGFYNLDKKSFVHSLGLIIRSNLFIPDPRRGWNRFAYRKACDIIRKEGIGTVVTSTPPHSSQLIGYKLKKKFKLHWAADLRDPWTDIFYYKILRHSWISRRIDRNYEHKVLLKADDIFTVSKELGKIFAGKDARIMPEKIHIIPNGYDEDDFSNLADYKVENDFIIGYTGTMSDQYEPWGFLRAFRNLVNQSEGNVRLEVTGTISQNIISYVEELGIKEWVKTGPVIPHAQIPSLLVKKSTLLLAIPRVENSRLILTGKLFEYLASRRPIILVGPENGDAASILEECEAGKSFTWDDEAALTKHLVYLKKLNDKAGLSPVSNDHYKLYSRKNQAAQISRVLFSETISRNTNN